MRAKTAAYVATTAAYLAWTRLGRDPEVGPVHAGITSLASLGADRGHGNLLVMQPAMEPGDYTTEPRFAEKIALYFRAAADRGWLGRRTVVVLPEHLARWLVLLGEKRAAARSRHQGAALGLLIASNPWRILAFARTQPQAGPMAALYHMQAAWVGRVWARTFGQLAKTYDVTIVGGSALLPNPHVVREGESAVIAPRNGPLMNVGAVFLPSGEIAKTFVRQCNVIAQERAYLRGAFPAHLPVYHTPAGRLGVLLGADARDRACWDVLREKGASLVLNPASAPFAPAPSPWLLQELYEAAFVRGFAASFERALWDRKEGGRAVLASGQAVYEGADQPGGSLVNLWR